MVCIHLGIEIAKEDELFLAENTLDGGCKALIKLVLNLRGSRQCGGVGTDKGDGARISVQAESQEVC